MQKDSKSAAKKLNRITCDLSLIDNRDPKCVSILESTDEKRPPIKRSHVKRESLHHASVLGGRLARGGMVGVASPEPEASRCCDAESSSLMQKQNSNRKGGYFSFNTYYYLVILLI